MIGAAGCWLGLMVLFLVVEAACPLHLVSIWFAAGSLAAMVISLLNLPVWLQIMVFILVSTVALFAFWPLVRKYLNPKITKTNVDAVVGSTGIVTACIDNISAVGQVKLGSMEWSARSESGKPIPEGTLVKVERIEGVKAIVSPVQEAVIA